MKTIKNTIRQYILMLTLVCVGVMTAQAATYTVNQLGDAGDGFMRPVDIPSYPNAANGSDIGAFEYQGATPTDKDQCKNGGWMNFDFPRTFINQGDCIQFVNTGR